MTDTKTMLSLLRVLICVCISTQLLAQVTNGDMENVVVCGESVTWEAITTGPGTLILDSLPPGFSFDGLVSSDCSATLISSTPPTFNVPAACILFCIRRM